MPRTNTHSHARRAKKLGDIVGVKPALAMGYGFDRQFSFPIDNVVPGDGYHMYCEINRGGESKSFPGVSSSGSVSFEYRLPWLDVEVSLQKWDGDSIRVDWGYYPWERVKHKEGRTFSIWRGKSSETPDKWELIAKNVAGWSYVDRTWAGRGFSKYTCW